MTLPSLTTISQAMRPDDGCGVLLQGRYHKRSQLCHHYELKKDDEKS